MFLFSGYMLCTLFALYGLIKKALKREYTSSKYIYGWGDGDRDVHKRPRCMQHDLQPSTDDYYY